jgi:hypothetical protein
VDWSSRTALSLALLTLALPTFPLATFAVAQAPQAAQNPGPPDFSGNWKGGFYLQHPDSTARQYHVSMHLTQDGTQLVGTLAPDDTNVWPISAPVLKDQQLTFVVKQYGLQFLFTLHREGNLLLGSVYHDTPKGLDKGEMHVELGPSEAEATPELKAEIGARDAAFFDAFNKRNLEGVKSDLEDDLEFRTKTGLANYEQSLQLFELYFNGPERLRRELDAGSLKVFPVDGYGAVETGMHRFNSAKPGEPETPSSAVHFLILWHQQETGWKIARIVTYD